MTARLLWTASRTLGFEFADLVRDMLLGGYGRHGTWDDPPIVVTGGCPAGRQAPGGDVLAERAAAELGFTVERWPADWSAPCRPTCRPRHRRANPRSTGTYCPAAGNYRNLYMVALGAHECLALVQRASKGATQCGQAAEAAGIPTVWERVS